MLHLLVVARNGTTIGYSQPVAVTYNGGYRYINGGNFYYTEMVKQYLSFNNGTAPVNGSETFKKIMEEALKYNGNPYVWGGKTPAQGFDCSGLTSWAFRAAGVNLNGSASEQYYATVEVDRKMHNLAI